jgi:hypothetical protein
VKVWSARAAEPSGILRGRQTVASFVQHSPTFRGPKDAVNPRGRGEREQRPVSSPQNDGRPEQAHAHDQREQRAQTSHLFLLLGEPTVRWLVFQPSSQLGPRAWTKNLLGLTAQRSMSAHGAFVSLTE